MPTRREFVASTVGVGVTAAASLAVAKGSAPVAPHEAAEAAAGKADIVITLQIVDGELTQSCDAGTKQRMVQRISHPGFERERKSRTPYGHVVASAHESDPGHVTIVANDKEVVEWRCSLPFVLELDRQPGLVAVDDTPSNPFGWLTPQFSVDQGSYHAIRGTMIPDSGAGKQRFYKFTAWAGGLKLDPDYVCGDPPPA